MTYVCHTCGDRANPVQRCDCGGTACPGVCHKTDWHGVPAETHYCEDGRKAS